MKRVGHEWMRAVNLKTRKLMDCCGAVPGADPSALRREHQSLLSVIPRRRWWRRRQQQELPRYQMWLKLTS